MNSNSLDTLIQVSNIGFAISAVICALGFGLAVFFFLKYDIRNIFLIQTGRAEKASVRAITEKSFKTGPMGTSINLDYESGTLKSWRKGQSKSLKLATEGKSKTEEQSSSEIGSSPGTEVLDKISPSEKIEAKAESGQVNLPPNNQAVNRVGTFTEDVISSDAAARIQFKVIDEIMLIHTNECA